MKSFDISIKLNSNPPEAYKDCFQKTVSSIKLASIYWDFELDESNYKSLARVIDASSKVFLNVNPRRDFGSSFSSTVLVTCDF